MINICIIEDDSEAFGIIVEHFEECKDILLAEYGMEMNIIKIYTPDFSPTNLLSVLTQGSVNMIVLDYELIWANRHSFNGFKVLHVIFESELIKNPFIFRSSSRLSPHTWKNTEWSEKFDSIFLPKSQIKKQKNLMTVELLIGAVSYVNKTKERNFTKKNKLFGFFKKIKSRV